MELDIAKKTKQKVKESKQYEKSNIYDGSNTTTDMEMQIDSKSSDQTRGTAKKKESKIRVARKTIAKGNQPLKENQINEDGHCQDTKRKL